MKEYEDIKQRISELSEKDKRFFDRVLAVDVGRYDFTTSTMLLVSTVYNNNALNAFNFIYKIGFMRGRNAEKRRVMGVNHE